MEDIETNRVIDVEVQTHTHIIYLYIYNYTNTDNYFLFERERDAGTDAQLYSYTRAYISAHICTQPKGPFETPAFRWSFILCKHVHN